MSFAPTPEQTEAVEKFATGDSLKINAYAGTGKTSTLTLLGKATPKIGQYVAFNSSIAKEAQSKFPGNVKCKTGHGLAFGNMVRTYGAPKMTANINGGVVAAKMGCKPYPVMNGDKLVMEFSARNWGYVISETVKRWMRSADDQIEAKHVPLDGKLGHLMPELLAPVRKDVVRDANKLWERMSDPHHDMPLTHDGYLKAWALTRPQIDAAFIMLDEAQDTNGVMMKLMSEQNAQLICVGDRWQQIYAWRGAQNAMVKLPSVHESRLSTSWRFGEAIADYATGILHLLGETIPLRGNPAKVSRIGPVERADTILCRTNGRVIESAFGLVKAGRRPHIVGGVDVMLTWIKATESLMAGRSVETPIELFGFQDWEDVKATAQQDQDPELSRWVRLISDYGCDVLRRMLESLPKQEAAADIILSTSHKAKGREWGRVRLENDMLAGIKAKEVDGKIPDFILPDESMEPELCLFYVAATRAMVELDVHPELQDRVDRLLKGLEVQRREHAARNRAMGRAA